MPHSLKTAIFAAAGAGKRMRLAIEGSGHLFHRVNPGECPAVGAFHFPEVIGGLQVEPVPRVNPEEPAEARRSVGCDGAPAGEYFAQPALRNPGGLGGSQLGDAEWFEKFVPQDEAGVG